MGYSPWGRKESDMTERLDFHFLSTMEIFRNEYLQFFVAYQTPEVVFKTLGLPWWFSGKNPPASIGDSGVRSLGQEDPLEKEMATLQFSRLGNPMDRGARWATVHGVTKSRTQLSN